MRLVQQAQSYLAPRIRRGDALLDATVGNGHDTAFLAGSTGPTGVVFGFDIQARAIENTRLHLQQRGLNAWVTLFQQGHETMLEHIPLSYQGRIKVVMFNLGYLPGSDKTRVTTGENTCVALQQATQLLAADGVLSIMAYPGHEQGAEETRKVQQWLQQLPSKQWRMHTTASDRVDSPRLIFVERI